MYYLTILDYSTGTVDQYDMCSSVGKEELKMWQSEDYEDFLVSEGYKLKDIVWMLHSDSKINKF